MQLAFLYAIRTLFSLQQEQNIQPFSKPHKKSPANAGLIIFEIKPVILCHPTGYPSRPECRLLLCVYTWRIAARAPPAG